jgi:N-acyl-D-amino-acid deacylase
MLDIKIVNGMLFDGSGAEAQRLDVGITGDSIASLGDLAAAEARQTIDAEGCLVCPGFIDAHTHSDSYLLIEPTSPSKIHQGVTTEICGNCGASAAPVTSFEHLPSDWADKSYPSKWSTTAEFRELIEAQGIGVNMVMMVGHNTLRRSFAGYENRAVTEDEMAVMVRNLEESLDAGAAGLSTGLIYAPGMFAPTEEIIKLAEITGRHGGIYTSHMRSEGDQLLEAISETINIGEKTGVRVQISHLKVSGRNNWHKIDAALELIQQARARGLQVAADRYPYVFGATDLDVVFPEWASDGGREGVLARLEDPDICSRLRAELIDSRDYDEWGGVLVGSTVHHDNFRFRGLSLIDVAVLLELPHPVDAIFHLCRNDKMMTGAFFAGMSEDNMYRILKEPYVMLGSDASLRSLSGPLGSDYPHPRAYGSVPRFLRMVIDKKIMPMQEAVRKMTSLPAQQFSLGQRGEIREGYAADIVVFNSDKLKDHATYAAPHAFASGVSHVLVNGKAVLADGRPTGCLSGRVIS